MRSAALLALPAAAAAAGEGGGAAIRLPFGSVRGNALASGHEFLGIPYAAPPARFDPPAPWTAKYAGGELAATKFTALCPQQPDLGMQLMPNGPYDEDCLTLNIYTPLRARKLPVMVWIHGGSLQTGTAMAQVYNGSKLAALENVVVVAINYRLNFFGFSPVVGGDGTVTANNGFRDQRMALRWVREHIEAFGGGGKVTIFGESAGGQSTTTHVLSTGSAGLFDHAISESGDTTNVASLDAGLADTAAMARRLGCAGAGDVACLRGAKVSTLLELCKQSPDGCGLGALVDGDVYKAYPAELARRGDFNRVPFMLGSNTMEGNLFLYPPAAPTRPASAGELRCAYAQLAPAAERAVLDLYPPVDAVGYDNRAAAAEALSDVFFHCDNRATAGALAAAGSPPWMYSFRRHAACPLLPVAGAFHGSEISFVFQAVGSRLSPLQPACNVSEATDLALQRQVARLWADFARTGRAPAGWPAFTAPEERVLKIDAGLDLTALDTERGFRRAQCDAIRAAGVNFTNSAAALFGGLAACQNKTALMRVRPL